VRIKTFVLAIPVTHVILFSDLFLFMGWDFVLGVSIVSCYFGVSADPELAVYLSVDPDPGFVTVLWIRIIESGS
jgi:hypothetical protein